MTGADCNTVQIHQCTDIVGVNITQHKRHHTGFVRRCSDHPETVNPGQPVGPVSE